MSETISLKECTARRSDTAVDLFHPSLAILGLLFFFVLIGAANLPHTTRAEIFGQAPGAAHAARVYPLSTAPDELAAEPAVLSPRMQDALDYVKRRYRVSAEALQPVFEMAQLIGKERRIDPLLIVAVIGIESGFNPFAESAMGAQGLMQVIPRFHRDKVPSGAGDKPLLDPLINITVGVRVLQEAIRRSGSLVAGLQYYAGSADDPAEGYASKVLAEKGRLENAARRGARPNPSA